MNLYLFFGIIILSYVIFVPLISYISKIFMRPKKDEHVFFKDKYKRLQIFHGVNVCNTAKTSEDLLPWHTEKEYQLLKDYGFNLVRFLIFWEGIEPEMNQYNELYISKVKKHIKMLNNLGISVILDIHQDLYNKKFTGNGFPDWTLPKEEYPFEPQKDWYMNYLQYAVLMSYRKFWKNKELKQQYIKMLIFVQEQFKDSENVIGIDIMNEPFPIIPFINKFEKNTLAEFYYDIELEVSHKNYRIPFMYEPAIHTSAGLPTYLLNSGMISGKKYIPHYYPPFCHNKGRYRWIDKWLMGIGLRAKARESQIFCSPYMIGEFGMGAPVRNRFKAIQDFLNFSEKYFINWMWYTYDLEGHDSQGLLDNNGNPNAVMDILSTPFPHYIAGASPKFYNEGDKFYLEYTSDIEYETPTEIYIPGKLINVKTNTEYTWDDNDKGIRKFYNRDKGNQIIEIIWQFT